ncbi:MAG: alpha-amylase family glycosyl hydrolase [Prevotella sp.]|jgi:alpha-amylase|nr:alpha-amylase family glycosyl hydrolase [Prevotella sp.]MCI1282100.1 alpha-amylase family glycosyl hydrolase [Prevotella sp.]
MKRFLTTLFLILSSVAIFAQGWPANYGGVMLQGFYWDSYSETKWTNLTAQADELSQYFDLIWVPNSGNCQSTTSMGYLPIWWFNETSSFGNEAELRAMIKAYKDHGTGIIEDVVINHKNGVSNWCDFANETWNGKSITWSMADICNTDECKDNGYTPTGAADEGDDFNGGRDLDHTGANVQKNVKIYLDFLLNDLGYIGFRYDMVKGYKPYYTGMYNSSANPEFSVGEYWDSNYDNVVNWIKETALYKGDGIYRSAAFDFPLKYSINNVFNNSTWSGLSNKGIAGDPNLSRYAVTFVDNHDTYRSTSIPVTSNILAANAFILALPGTPCILLPHWTAYQDELKKMILARKAAGVTNQSSITTQTYYTNTTNGTTTDNGYITEVTGTNARILVESGYTPNYNANSMYRYKAVSVGTTANPNYAFYISEDDPMTYHPDHLAAYFEVPASYGQIYCWAWNSTTNFTGGTWPGVQCTFVGTASNGNNIWRWETTSSETPTNIIFTNKTSGNYQTGNLVFTNGGYYVYGNDGAIAPATKTMNPTMSSTGYDRTFTENQHSTVCLPFALSAEDVSKLDGKLYKMSNYDSKTGTIYFTRVTSTEAYKPYMFLANTTAKSFEIFKWVPITTGSVSEDVINGMHFIGTMSRQNLVSSNTTNTYFGYKETDGTFIQAGTTNGVNVNPYRCYFYTKADGSAKINNMVFDDTTTGITTPSVNLQDHSGNVYSLDGRIVRSAGSTSQLSKGIYIINGKKIVIR